MTVLKEISELRAQLEKLESRFVDLADAFSIFQVLATPRMAQMFQTAVGGLELTPEEQDWRLQDFFNPEHASSAGGSFAWGRYDERPRAYMFVLSGEEYVVTLDLAPSPNTQRTEDLILKVDGVPVRPTYDVETQVYSFTYEATKTGWAEFEINARECHEPSLHGSYDLRRLGVMFRSLTLVPILR
jgi:hypothetical protein